MAQVWQELRIVARGCQSRLAGPWGWQGWLAALKGWQPPESCCLLEDDMDALAHQRESHPAAVASDQRCMGRLHVGRCLLPLPLPLLLPLLPGQEFPLPLPLHPAA